MANPQLMLECCICLEPYDTNIRKPCIGVCGHTICTVCRDGMATSNCPHCNFVEAFTICTINSQMIEIMTAMENIPKCASCNRTSSKLRICVPCNDLPIVTDKNASNISLNFSKLAICGECIFEQDHGEHETILLKSLSFIVNNAGSLGRIEKKFDLLEKCSTNIFESVTQQLSETCQIFQKFRSKNMSVETIEVAFERFQDVLFDFQQHRFQFQRIEEQISKQHEIVKNTNKAYKKPFAHLNPILFAIVSKSVETRPLICSFDVLSRKLEIKGSMQYPMSECAVASSKNGIYIIGGKLNGSKSSVVEIYKHSQNYRKSCRNLKTARSQASAAFHNGKIYVCGGRNKKFLRDVEVYSENTEQWIEGPPLMNARGNCEVISADSDLYVLGGIGRKCSVRTVEKLNRETGKFEIVSSMNERSSFASSATSGKIHVVGGVNSESQCLQTYETFDLVTCTWTSQPNMQTEGYCIFLHAFEDSLFAFKKTSDVARTVMVEIFNFNTQQWNNLEEF